MEFKIEYLLVVIIILVVLIDFITKKRKNKLAAKAVARATKTSVGAAARAAKNKSSATFQDSAPKKPAKLIFIGLIISFVALLGLGYVFFQVETKNSLTKENLKGDVKKISEYSFVALDKLNGMRKGQLKRNDGEADFKKTFNLRGNLVEYFNLKNQTTATNTYDEKHNIVEGVSKDLDGNLLLTNKYKYDSNNNVIERSQYDSIGNFNFKNIYKYDSDHNLIENISYDLKKNLSIKFSYKYDSNDNLIEKSLYDSIENFKSKFTYVYNTTGNIMEKSLYDSIENFKSKFTYEYEYDKNNNWVNRVEFKNLLPTFITVRKIQYHSDDISISDKEETSLDYFYKGYHSKRSDTAKFYFDKAILIDSSFASAYFFRGERTWEGKDHAEKQMSRLLYFTKAIEIDPNYIDAIRARAEIRGRGYGKGRSAALEDYDKLIEINPNDIDVHFKRIRFYIFRNGRNRSFVQDKKWVLDIVNKVFEIDPNNYRAHYYRGEWAEDDLEAIAAYTKAIESDLDNENPYIYIARAECKVRLKDYHGAIDDYENTIMNITEERREEARIYYIEIAYLNAFKLFNYSEAIKVATQAINIFDEYNEGDYAEGYFIRAFSKEYLGDYRGACLDIKKVNKNTRLENGLRRFGWPCN